MSNYIKVSIKELGKVQIRNATGTGGGVAQDFFLYLLNYDLNSGVNNMYYDDETDTLYFDSSTGDLSGDINGTSIGFLEGSPANLYDPLGIITIFGENAFAGNIGGNNYLGGNVSARDNFFHSAEGLQNTIYGINSCGHNFLRAYNGSITILANIGQDNTNDLGNNFKPDSNPTIRVLASHATSNSGGIEGDLQRAITLGATVEFSL
jgi:hypothetical protein